MTLKIKERHYYLNGHGDILGPMVGDRNYPTSTKYQFGDQNLCGYMENGSYWSSGRLDTMECLKSECDKEGNPIESNLFTPKVNDVYLGSDDHYYYAIIAEVNDGKTFIASRLNSNKEIYMPICLMFDSKGLFKYYEKLIELTGFSSEPP